jgi:hypothetical protein
VSRIALRAATVVSLLAFCGSAGHADPRRKVAVLEYRAGSRGAPDVGARLAAELARLSSYEVMEPAEARRRLGPGLDADVARCAGAAPCVAAIAVRLGADEALLVGVSQLGDVVLALQRVDAKRALAVARLAESLPAEKSPEAGALDEWLHQLFPDDAFRRYGSIRVVSDVNGAKITLNGTAHGTTPNAEGLRVPAPGTYRVRLDKAGYVPFQARIDVPPDAVVEVRAILSRESGSTLWYKRWYVWAVVGGAAAATGAGLAAYYGTRVDQTPHGFLLPPPAR